MKNDRSDAAGHDNKCALWSISKLTQLKKWTCIGNIKLNDSIASPALTVSVHLIIHYDLVPSDWSSSIFFRPVIKLFFVLFFHNCGFVCFSLSAPSCQGGSCKTRHKRGPVGAKWHLTFRQKVRRKPTEPTSRQPIRKKQPAIRLEIE